MYSSDELYLAYKIGNTEVSTFPFPHMYINNVFPNSLYLLHIHTLINKKIGNYIDAKYSGEQILFRSPKNKKNLNNLISIYRKLDDTKNLNKVNKILDNYKNEIY